MSCVAKVSTAPAEREAVDYRLIGLLSAAHLSDDINQGVVPAMLPFLIAAGHLSYAAAAGLVLAQTLFSSIVQPLFGLIADRRPSAWLIPVGLSLAGIGVALTGLTHSYWLIFAAIAISGLGISAFHPEAARRVRFVSGERAATSMSLFTVGGMVGFAIGPVLITPVLIAMGTSGAALLAIPVVSMGIVVAHQLPRLSAVTNPMIGHTAMGLAPDTQEQWSDFVRLTIVVILRSTVFFGLDTFVPLYWINVLHGSKSGAGYALTTMLTAVVAGTLIGGRMADRYGRTTVLAVSMAALVPAMLAFLGCARLSSAGLSLVPIGIALAASTSVVVVMGQEYLPTRVGLAAGITLGLSMTIGGLLMPVFGAIADNHGLSVTMLLLSIVPAIGFAVSLTLHEPSGGLESK